MKSVTFQQEIIQELQRALRSSRNAIKESTKSFEKDFCHAFRWYAEDMYQSKIWEKELFSILNEEATTEEYIYDIIKDRIEELGYFLSKSFNVMERSTNQMHREASLIEYRTKLEIVEYLKNIIK